MHGDAMSAYPVPFAHDRFATVPDFDPGVEASSDSEEESHSVSYKGVLSKKNPPRALAKAVWIQQDSKTGNVSQSFENVTEDDPEITKHYAFIPGIDDMTISWVVADNAVA